MAIERHHLTTHPKPRMSKCVVHDNMVYLSGVTAVDRSAGIKGQSQEILDTIDTYLHTAGTSKSNVLRVNIWITDQSLFGEFNEVWESWVDHENPPARACVVNDLVVPGLLVEIMVTAVKQ